jgi:S-adenosylmethionine synthetase
MSRNIIIEDLGNQKIESQDVEIVERKGLGHPDTICDAASEAASRELSKFYLKEFGTILHHNVDKALLVAGKAEPKYGGGKIVKPIKLVIAGRATTEFNGKSIPAAEIVANAAKECLKSNLHGVNIDEVFSIDTEIGGGSVDLQEVFCRDGIPCANDTSFGVGFAPFSTTEKLVLESAGLLHSREFMDKNPVVGADVKVMGTRKHNKIDITVAVAIIDKYINSTNEYFEAKVKISEALHRLADCYRDGSCEINFHINTGDNREKKIVYITTTGLSAEMGDDGQVGRGNRVNGLITVRRPMSLEAAAGKNPVNHVGKLYNVLANVIAKDLVEKVDEIDEAYVNLLSQIGISIDQPQTANVLLSTKNGAISEEIKKRAEEICAQNLDQIQKITERIVNGDVLVY